MFRRFCLVSLCFAFGAPGTASAADHDMTFFVRIHPARANFLSTMTPAESKAMELHFAYWKARMAEHKLILAGPVPISPGTFGILIIRARTLGDAEQLVRDDPSVVAHVTDYEIYPLRLALYEGDDSTAASP
jgi:uncharacterized protein YciI